MLSTWNQVLGSRYHVLLANYQLNCQVRAKRKKE